MHPDTFLFAVSAIITDSICYQKLQKEYFLLLWLLGRPMKNKNCDSLKGVNLKAQVYNKFQQTKNKQRWITNHMLSSYNIFLMYETFKPIWAKRIFHLSLLDAYQKYYWVQI